MESPVKWKIKVLCGSSNVILWLFKLFFKHLFKKNNKKNNVLEQLSKFALHQNILNDT